MVSHTVQFAIYFVISNWLALGTIYTMLEESPTFYAAGVKLSEGVSIIILANWLVSLALIIGKGLQRLLFGDLRLIEIERIYERSRFTVINSLIALTMFSNDFLLIPGILTLFSLFLKVFHWILKDRFEFIFQNATRPSQVILTRNTVTLVLLLYVDFKLVYSCAEYCFGRNPDVYFAFGFEFVTLFLDLILQTGKIILNTWELFYLRSHPDEDSMEDKSYYMKLLGIAHTALTLSIQVFLLFTFIGPYRFPIYLFKDLFFNTISMATQIKEFRRYQRAAKELDSRLPNAVDEDLDETHNLCIICLEDMTTEGISPGYKLNPKKLSCGHIIHLGCLKGWFARSQVCPMCKAPVFGNNNQQTRPQPQPQQPQPQPQPEHRPEPPNATHQHLPVPDLHERHDVPTQQHQQPINPINTHHSAVSPTLTINLTRTLNTHTTSSHPRTHDPNALVLRPGSLVPPDWTLLRLSNRSLDGNQYELNLNGTRKAIVLKVSHHPIVDPVRIDEL